MDVARYADTDGFEQDYVRPNAWRYRDYVIDSLNDDKPYHQFLREQIAGDELDHVTDETRIATGFLRAGPRVNFREKDNPERRHDYLDDVLATVGRGVLGMTVHCARCHDHKFDPILQKDYYSLQASIFGYVEIDYPLLDRSEADAYFDAMRAIDQRQQPLRDRVDAIEAPYREALRATMIRERFPENVQAAAFKPEAERSPGEQLLAAQVLTLNPPRRQVAAALRPEHKTRVEELRARISALEDERPPAPAMAHIVTDGDYRFAPDGPGDNVIGCPECRTPPEVDGTYLWEEGGADYTAPPNYFLIRGDPFSPGSEMSPGFLTAATYDDPATAIPRPDGRTSGRRLALAEWIASRDNPLTARVIVNRIWHHHFGRGIVRTLDNLGRMGDAPTHPALLDWLAVEFMDRGWSMKEMHRLLMTSEAYRMASSFPHEASTAADPENNLLWRYRPQRIEAEILRDSIMTVSGGIDLTVGGPPVFPARSGRHPVPVGRQGILVRQPRAGTADHRPRHRHLVRGARPSGGVAPQRLRLPAPFARLPVLRHLRPAGSEPDRGGAQRLHRLDAGADADEQPVRPEPGRAVRRAAGAGGAGRSGRPDRARVPDRADPQADRGGARYRPRPRHRAVAGRLRARDDEPERVPVPEVARGRPRGKRRCPITTTAVSGRSGRGATSCSSRGAASPAWPWPTC